jgi:hypothetical protein
MQVRAQALGDPRFVVETRPGFASVVDLRDGRVYPELDIQAIAARPGWGPVRDQEGADRALELARPADAPLV